MSEWLIAYLIGVLVSTVVFSAITLAADRPDREKLNGADVFVAILVGFLFAIVWPLMVTLWILTIPVVFLYSLILRLRERKET